MLTKTPYAVAELTDEVMGINVKSMINRLDRYRDRLNFAAGI